MTDENVNVEQQVDTTDWKAKAAEFEAEALKQRNIAKDLIAQRDAGKKVPKVEAKDDVTDYLKTQLDEVTSRISKYADKAKSGAITAAATTKLSAMGINPDALELAIKQLDKSLIQYDEDSEMVDDTALSAAVSKLKSKHAFLFEQRVGTSKVRLPADGSSKADSNTMSQDEWKSLSSREQRVAIKAGRRVA